MHEAVIVGYARTPIGTFGGGLAGLTAVDLGGSAIAAALERAGMAPEQVSQVVMGHVVQAGQGQISARQAARAAGIPMTSPALTLNKVCLSGMAALAHADQQIRLGEADVVVAGGMESMSQAPFLVPRARFGYRLGDGRLVDALIRDGLWCAFDDAHMGALGDRTNARLGISRQAQDEWAAMSHERAAAAWKDGRFADEVAPVTVPGARDEQGRVDTDEGIRPQTSVASLARLPAVFDADGTITAGNASQISDGAAAVVLSRRDRAAELGLTPLARVLASASVAGPDASLHHQPAAAIEAAVGRLGIGADTLDRYEINEAFASVALHATGLLGVDRAVVNVNGGAVALGHPIGCSGARIVVTLLAGLARRGGGRGAAALCGGGGQGDALILETLA